MKLQFRTDIDAMFAGLDAKIRERMPITVAIAMTQTAQDVYGAMPEAMDAAFRDPTPWTKGATRYSKATPGKLSAEVWLDDEFRGGGAHPAAEYLIPQIDGGIRARKRSEWILEQTGILPPGMSIVPARSLELDPYGNVSTGLIQRILSALRVSETIAGHTSDRPRGPLNARQRRAAARAGEYFVAHADSPHTRHLHPGIYQRTADGIKALILFVATPHYDGVFDFAGVAQATADETFEGHLREQMAVTFERLGV